MNINELPRDPARILEAMRQQEESPKIARLALLCLWLAGQSDDPRKNSAGPGGAKPLEHLWLMLERVQIEKDASTSFPSYLAHLMSYYPPPRKAAPKRQSISEAEARRQTDAVFKEARAATTTIKRHAVICEGLIRLAEQGNPYLQPLIEHLVQHIAPQEKEYQYDNALEALMRAGEIDRALKILNTLKISPRMDSFRRIRCARILIALGQTEKAQETLKRLWVQPGQLAEDVVKGMSIAECYAYLGDAQTARELAPKDSINLEYLIAWQQYCSGQAVDISPILALVKSTLVTEMEPPKVRAAAQIDALSFLLKVEQYEAGFQMLPDIQATLLAIPLWGKLEYRAGNAAEALLPYADQFETAIYVFTRDLMIQKAMEDGKNGGIWPMVQVVSGLGRLIVHWAGENEVHGLIDFLKAWHNQAVE